MGSHRTSLEFHPKDHPTREMMPKNTKPFYGPQHKTRRDIREKTYLHKPPVIYNNICMTVWRSPIEQPHRFIFLQNFLENNDHDTPSCTLKLRHSVKHFNTMYNSSNTSRSTLYSTVHTYHNKTIQPTGVANAKCNIANVDRIYIWYGCGSNIYIWYGCGSTYTYIETYDIL